MSHGEEFCQCAACRIGRMMRDAGVPGMEDFNGTVLDADLKAFIRYMRSVQRMRTIAWRWGENQGQNSLTAEYLGGDAIAYGPLNGLAKGAAERCGTEGPAMDAISAEVKQLAILFLPLLRDTMEAARPHVASKAFLPYAFMFDLLISLRSFLMQACGEEANVRDDTPLMEGFAALMEEHETKIRESR